MNVNDLQVSAGFVFTKSFPSSQTRLTGGHFHYFVFSFAYFSRLLVQDDDYDDYDDYGEIDVGVDSSQPAYPVADPYSQPEQISYVPTSYATAEATLQQSSYTPPEQPSYSPPAQTGLKGGLNNMSSMGSSLPAAPPANKYGGGDKCPRCLKTVYFAEAKEGPNNIKYHKYVISPVHSFCLPRAGVAE